MISNKYFIYSITPIPNRKNELIISDSHKSIKFLNTLTY